MSNDNICADETGFDVRRHLSCIFAFYLVWGGTLTWLLRRIATRGGRCGVFCNNVTIDVGRAHGRKQMCA